MHIYILNDFSYVNGGASYVALRSAKVLAQRGLNVTLLSAVGDNRGDDALYTAISLGQKDILSESNLLKAATRGIWNRKAARCLGELLEKEEPDDTIIHMHSWTKALSSSVVSVASARGVHVVITLHDYFIACPNGAFFDYPAGMICDREPLSWRCISRNCDVRKYSHKVWRLARQWVQNRVFRKSMCNLSFITVSQFSEAILAPLLPSSATVCRIENPIDIEKSEPASVGCNDTFVYVGRLSEEKGVKVFAEAVAPLGVKVVFVGDGPCRAQVEALCPEALVTGWVSQDEVRRYIGRARVVVCPSVCYETQGMVVLEAMALGVPVVVSDGIAPSEYVTDGVDGRLFSQGDALALRYVLDEFRDGARAQVMGEAAWEQYWSNPSSVEQHVTRLEACYRMLLGNLVPQEREH